MIRNPKAASWSLGILISTAVINGLLSGGNVDRALVAMPAWRQTGPLAWAQFSLYADLGNGSFLYPAMAISATLAIVAAAVLFLCSGSSPRNARVSVVLAAVLMVAALPFSLKAAPFMLGIRHVDPANVTALAHAFSGFEFWGRLQGIFHVASFCVNVWAISAVSRWRAEGSWSSS